jgi:thymidylate synthase
MKMFDASNIWAQKTQQIMLYGNHTQPRGIDAQEIIASKTITNMNYPFLAVPERKLNVRFLAGEAWWILMGSNRVEDIEPFMKAITKFSDNGVTFDGAYGPKFTDQISYVVDALANDTNSRQAVMSIWRENPRPSKDIPCTLSFQWLIRNGTLHCVASMRSSDIWLGWVYDTFNFSMLSAYIAIFLKRRGIEVVLGNLYLTAGSQHLYLSDAAAAGKIVTMLSKEKAISYEPFDLDCYCLDPDELVHDLLNAAQTDYVNCSPFMAQLGKINVPRS